MKHLLKSMLIFMMCWNSYAHVDVINEKGESFALEEDLTNIRFGNNRYDGEAIGKIIGLINKNRAEILKVSETQSGKIYFRPHFNGSESEKQGRIFVQNGTASLRLQQVVYFNDPSGKKIYIPFEGAEINAYISGLVPMQGRENEGVVHKGKLIELSSSLVNALSFKGMSQLLEGKNKESLKAVQGQVVNLEILKAFEGVDWSLLAEAIYQDKTFITEGSFKRFFLMDKGLQERIFNESKAELMFVFDERLQDFVLVRRIKNIFRLPFHMDFRVEGASEGPAIVKVKKLSQHVQVRIYTGSSFNLAKKERRNGESSVWQHKEVERGLFRQEDYDLALINLSKVVEYFKNVFNWNGFDNRGSDLKATVRFKGSKFFGTAGLRQNAAWVGSPYNQFLFGRGGDTLGDFLNAHDVIGHEYCHAIIAHTSQLEGGNQPGALNEHLCDILGVGFESELEQKSFDFSIGEKVVMDKDQGLRHFLNPLQSFSSQADHMRDVESKFGPYCVPMSSNDECGVHYSNGVMNKAIGLSVRDLGWPKMKGLVFEVATKKLRSKSDFKDYGKQTVRTCRQMSSFNDSDCDLIAGHFKSVGLNELDGSGHQEEAEDVSSFSDTDFDAELCSILMNTCQYFENGDLHKKCVACGYKY